MEAATKTAIKATELRIGNLLVLKSDKVTLHYYPYVRVTGINKDEIEVEGQFKILYSALHLLHPITLTPEILEKCGFVNKPSKSYKLSYELEASGFASTFRTWWYREDICIEPMGYDTGHIGIQYLHQLQNLYFALTGEELQINL